MTLPSGAARSLARAHGLDEDAVLEGPVARGELSELFRLRTGSGSFAVKAPFAPLDPRDLADPAAFAEAAASAGIATPRVLRGLDGQLVHVVEGRQLLLLDWLDIAPLAKDLEPAAVGALVASTHRVPFRGGSSSGNRSWFTDPVGADEWDHLVGRCRSAGAPFAESFAAYRDELVHLESLLDPLPADRTCHRDLWADNVRALRTGGLCVFDWDSCGPASQSEELAMVLFEFGLGDVRRHRTLYEAYRDAGGPGRLTQRRGFTMLVAVCGHIGRWQVLSWLAATAGSEERAHAEGAVGEFLGLGPHQRLDRSALTAMLDAVT